MPGSRPYARIDAIGAHLKYLAYAAGLCHPPAIYQGNGRTLTRTVHGNRMICFSNDLSITPSLLLNGIWERHISNLILGLVPRRPGAFVAEVGANIGYFSVLIGRQLNTATMHVFEAARDIYDVLRDNILLNGLDGHVTAHNRVVIDENKFVNFAELERHKGAGSILPFDADYLQHYGEHTTVHGSEGVSLDSQFDTIANLDLLKIDAEGAELLILKGAREILTRSRNSAVICEFNRVMLAST